MRITIWLSIAVFVSTLYWPQLLNYSGIFACVLSIFVLIHWAKYRYLATLPVTAAYFSLYTVITLSGLSSDSILYTNEIRASDNLSIRHESPLNQSEQNVVSFLSNASTEQDNIITVQVRSLVNTKNTGYFIANLISINNVTCVICPLIEMRWFNPQFKVQAGQVHQFKVRFKFLYGKGNPNGFDRQKWRYSEHIAYIGNIREHIAIIDTSITLRARLYQKMLQVTDSLPQQGALLALVFADKSLMRTEDKERIKALGIAHLFAISGLHIGLLFAFSFVIVNSFCKNILPIQYLGWFSWRLVNVASFMVCLGYGYISGFSLPTQRALVMLFISMLILSSKQKVGLFDLLVLCLWIMLLMDPLAILSSSLWLSFTAMSAILLFIWSVRKSDEVLHQPLTNDSKVENVQHNTEISRVTYCWQQPWLQKAVLYIKWLILLQVILTLFMLPIQLLNFSAISVYSLFINLIAIPLFSWLIIPMTLFATFVLLISEPIALMLLTISNTVLTFFLACFDGFTAGYLHFSESNINNILSFFLLMLLMLILVVLKRFFTVNNFTIGILCSSFVLFVLTSGLEQKWEEEQDWQVEIFDIGQGLSVLISSNGQYLLYDTGPSYPPNYAVAEVEVLPYLQARGIAQLDYLIVSHSDNDHAGGIRTIARSLFIKNAYSGEAELVNGKSVYFQQCIAGQTFQLGRLNVKILAPSKVGKNNNNNSCVVSITDGKNTLLLTGDINKQLEKRLVNQTLTKEKYNVLKADILIAPHHGSATSSSLAFIKQVDPSWVVFPAGYKNRWDFPKRKVTKRYQQQGVKQITTGESGFIRFNVQNQHIEVKTYREDLAAYWYHQHLVF